jgi:ribonuclease P protein component
MAPFAIVYAPNNLLYPRLGISIAKRLVPRATDRNRLKRLIRESFRLHAMTLNSIDIIVQCADVPTTIRNIALRERLSKVWYMLSKQRNQI